MRTLIKAHYYDGKEALQDDSNCDYVAVFVSGVIIAVGSEVTSLEVEDEAVGLAYLSPSIVDVGDVMIFPMMQVMTKPSSVSHHMAAASLYGGLRAYTALYYKFRITSGESILIYDGASEAAHMALQLAVKWGAMIFTTARSLEEIHYINTFCRSKQIRIIDLNKESVENVIENETCGIGVDYILESPSLLTFEESLRMKRINIKCIAPHGHVSNVDDRIFVLF